jgi:hypothetical protein
MKHQKRKKLGIISIALLVVAMIISILILQLQLPFWTVGIVLAFLALGLIFLVWFATVTLAALEKVDNE